MRNRMNRLNKLLIISIVLIVNIQLLSGYEIQKMCKKIFLNQDGSASVNVNVEFSTNEDTGILQLPLIFGDVKINNATFESGVSNLEVNVVNNSVFNYMELPYNLNTGDHYLKIDYTIINYLDWEEAGPGEFRRYEFATSVENTFPTTIDTFVICTVLPEGWNYHKIIGSAPGFGKKDPKPPYTLDQIDGRFCATISRTPMEYRDKVALEFIFKSTKKSYTIVFVGLIFIGLYLFFFRNLIDNSQKTSKIDKVENNSKNNYNGKGEKHAK